MFIHSLSRSHSVLYILLIIVNMLLLQAFFGGDPRFSVLRHGLWVLENLFTLSVWPQSPIFPIKTVCTFSVKQLAGRACYGRSGDNGKLVSQ